MSAELPAALRRGQARRDPGPGRCLFTQRRSRQFHRRSGEVGCGARPAGFPGGEDAGDEQAKASQEIKGFLGWVGFIGAKVDDLTHKTKLTGLLRARLRWLSGCAQEEPEEADHRSCPPGAR